MAKFAELISGLEIKGAKAANSKIGKKLATEVDKANRPVKPVTMTKAERKAMEARFEENNRIAREREAARVNRAKEQAKKRREEEATAKKQ